MRNRRSQRKRHLPKNKQQEALKQFEEWLTIIKRICAGRQSQRSQLDPRPHLGSWSATELPSKRDHRKPVAAADAQEGSLGGTGIWVVAAVLGIAIALVYGHSLDAPFIFDDVDGIENNDSIRSLWPLVGAAGAHGPVNPPANLPSSGRPLVNLSLAVNFHWSGLNPRSYHASNLLIHFLATLVLCAIVRRALLLPYFADRFEASANWLALFVALLWALHPLQTEAVAYVTQRSELMVGLFFLATLYCSLRYWISLPGSRPRTIWLTLAVVASLAGMASKEVMVTAPVMVLLFDRAFVSGSLGGALRRSWPLYLGLALTWLLLLALNIDSPRGKSAGFGLGPPLGSWWMTQSQILLMYLKLVVWPWPLLIHYRLPYLESFSQAWMYVIPVLLLLAATLVFLWRNHPTGYLLSWLLFILAPTSIVPIVSEIAAERRMYLPLASLAVLFVVGGWSLVQRRVRVSAAKSPRPPMATFAPVAVIVLLLGLMSANRIRAYQDPTILWRDVIRHQPQNALAHGNLGGLYARSGRLTDGIEELRTAVSLDPEDHTVLTNLGQALTDTGKLDEAREKLAAAVAQEPDDPLALNNLGVALIHAGRFQDALAPLQRAVKLRPSFAIAHNSLGGALAGVGRNAEAIEQFRAALAIDPALAMASANLDALYHNTNRPTRSSPRGDSERGPAP
jgi:Flp pilus assembly protein TadD